MLTKYNRSATKKQIESPPQLKYEPYDLLLDPVDALRFGDQA